MKHLYYIFIVLFLGSTSPQKFFAASAAAAVEAPDIAGLRNACQQALDIMRTTFISRQEYMKYIDTHREELLERLPPHITPEMLDAEGKRWHGFILSIDKNWETFDGYMQKVMESNYDLSLLENLINKTPWSQFGMNRNRTNFEAECPNLLELSPEIRRIYKDEAEIFGDAARILLSFMPKAYQEDFERCTMQDVGPIIRPADGARGGAIPKSGVVRHGSNVEVTTSFGTRVQFLLPYLAGINIGAKAHTDKFDLIFKMKSGFEISCGYLAMEEANLLMHATNKAFTADDDERVGMRKLAVMEEVKAERKARQKETEARAEADRAATFAAMKAERDRRKGKSGSSAAAPVTSEALAAKEAEARRLAEEFIKSEGGEPLGGARGKKKVGKKSDASSAAPSAVSMAEVIPEKADHLVPAGAGEGGASALPSSPIASAAGGASSAAADALATTFSSVPQERSGPPPHRVLIPVVDPSGKIDRTYATREGPRKKPLETLTVLLGEPLEGRAVTPIHTVDWGNMVDMLEDLGFHHTSRDGFVNNRNQRLHLHALHYDDYRMNYKLLGILFRQLAYYGFTSDALKGLLAGASGPSAGVGSA